MPVQKQPFGTWCLIQFRKSRIEVFVNCSAFGSSFLCQFFLVRENLRGLRENFETQNPNLGPLCRVPIKSEMMAKWGDGDLLSFLEHNRAKVVLKLYKNFNTIGYNLVVHVIQDFRIGNFTCFMNHLSFIADELNAKQYKSYFLIFS